MHYMISGATGSGKSNTMLGILVAAAMSDCSILLLDPHGTLAREFLRHLLYRGLMNKVRFDDYGKMDRTLAIASLVPSTSSDPWKAAQEDQQTVNEWKGNLLYVRGKQDATQNPIFDARLDLVGHTFLSQSQPAEEYWLAGALDFSTDQHRSLRAHCTRPDLVAEFEQLERLPPSQRNFEMAPVDRLLKKHYGNPEIVARLRADRFDEMLDAGMILIDDASGAARENGRSLMGKKILRFMNKVRKGCNKKTVIVLEESETANTAEAHFVRFLAESRKWNTDCYLLNQNPLNYATPEIANGVWQNTGHIHHRQASPACAEVAADEIATMLYSSTKIHRKEYSVQQLHDGYQKIDGGRTSKSVTTDKYGSTLQKGQQEQEADQYLGKYKQVEKVMVFYKDWTTQKQEIKQQLMTLLVGWAFIVNEKVTPEPVYIPMAKEPKSWAYRLSHEQTLGDKKLQDALSLLYQHPDYQPPQLRQPS